MWGCIRFTGSVLRIGHLYTFCSMYYIYLNIRQPQHPSQSLVFRMIALHNVFNSYVSRSQTTYFSGGELVKCSGMWGWDNMVVEDLGLLEFDVMWCFVIGWMAPSLLKECSSFIFSDEAVRKEKDFFCCLLLKMEALWSFKMSGITHPVTHYHIPEDLNS
jgi:hypothetical protein